MIEETACAKINLTLSVGEKRSDGYHTIDSIMHSISLCDDITLERAEGISLTIVEGRAPSGKENLMVKAAELFLREKGISGGVRMTLAKHIPSEAGMGGGSSDAAAVLRGLARLYGTGDGLETLAAMGASLGADVPFCVRGGACRCEGIGEVLVPLTPWPGLPLLIVRPETSVSTGEAYRLLDGRDKRPKDRTEDAMKALADRNRQELYESLSNDFEDALFPKNEVLKETSSILHSLGRPTLMTGSGSAFFLFPKDREEGKALAEDIRKSHPSWFVETAETVGKGKS